MDLGTLDFRSPSAILAPVTELLMPSCGKALLNTSLHLVLVLRGRTVDLAMAVSYACLQSRSSFTLRELPITLGRSS